ncbi:hypothetical protein A3860_36865 [Niastella vici]|uniref:IPT/TIG domain-containing protein n=1 Tax=Niastella vici TaxID=1703345 RepID=A0A1V9FMI4_9BACT|nr:hypothetical protein [Niastella vici]OQP59565.1 hypothetical protein A3860_36865 [Niastella vici]
MEANNNNQPADKKPYTDSDGNQITTLGKLLGGTFLVLLTFFCLFYLIAHWPDRLPAHNSTQTPYYTYEWFHVRLVDSVSKSAKTDSVNKTPTAGNQTGTDTLHQGATADSAPVQKTDLAQMGMKGVAVIPAGTTTSADNKLLNLNTLLLILVALGGFLGNMIYISTSFTTFIGNGQFKKSWLLWYIVKPFTAAGLAIAIYFVFRGGFLNLNDDSSSINLYGLMTISILAGLFTDRTTLKLKEVFDVVLTPREERKDPITNKIAELQVTNITAPKMQAGTPTPITIEGKNLDKKPVFIKINGAAITNFTRQQNQISLTYTPAAGLQPGTKLPLEITNEKGESLYQPYNLEM